MPPGREVSPRLCSSSQRQKKPGRLTPAISLQEVRRQDT